ncbi:MAG: hypothetical protein GY771_07615 [bacterium]|nr:hypothetical protein [bacterium]
MKVSTRLTLLIAVFIIVIITVGCAPTVKGKFIPTNPNAKLRPKSTTKPVWAVGSDYRPYDEIGVIEVTVCLGSEGEITEDPYDLAKEKMLGIASDNGCDAITSVKSKSWNTASWTSYDAVNDVSITHPSVYFTTYTGTAVIWR